MIFAPIMLHWHGWVLVWGVELLEGGVFGEEFRDGAFHQADHLGDAHGA